MITRSITNDDDQSKSEYGLPMLPDFESAVFTHNRSNSNFLAVQWQNVALIHLVSRGCMYLQQKAIGENEHHPNWEEGTLQCARVLLLYSQEDLP